MIKKMMLLAVAAAAVVAFAVPAAASANVTLTDSSGTLEAGAQLTASSANTVTTIFGENKLECEEVHLEGEALGSGTTITGIAAEGEGVNCVAQPSGAPTLVTHIEAELSLGAGGSGNALFAFEFDIPAAGLTGCIEETVGSGVGINWTDTTNTVHVAGGPLAGSGPEGCPAGAERIDGTFHVTTEDGDPVIIHG